MTELRPQKFQASYRLEVIKSGHQSIGLAEKLNVTLDSSGWTIEGVDHGHRGSGRSWNAAFLEFLKWRLGSEPNQDVVDRLLADNARLREQKDRLEKKVEELQAQLFPDLDTDEVDGGDEDQPT